MLALLWPIRLARVSGRRIASAALLALQMLIAVSPAIERQNPVRPSVHVHDQGARHRYAHDESSCALCGVRGMAADAPVGSLGDHVLATRSEVVVLDGSVVPTTAVGPAHPPRAPPVLN